MRINFGIIGVGLSLGLGATIALAKNSILVASPSTRANDYQRLLNSSPQFVSLIDHIETEQGAVPRELVQAVHSKLLNGTIDQSWFSETELLQKELTKTFLSPLRKNLLLALMRKKETPGKEPNTTKQILLLQQDPTLSSGGYKPPLSMPRDADRLYINGFRIEPEELSRLRVNPDYFYHVAYLSNITAPQFFWGRGKDIPPIKNRELVTGSCLQPHFEELEVEEPVVALFPENCRTNLASAQPSQDSGYEARLGATMDSPQQFWTPERRWAIGGSIVLIGLLLNEANKHYDISIATTF